MAGKRKDIPQTQHTQMQSIKAAAFDESPLDEMIRSSVQATKETRNQETKKPLEQETKKPLEQGTLMKGVQTKIPMSLYSRVVELKTVSQATGRKELNTIDKIVTEALTRLLESELNRG